MTTVWALGRAESEGAGTLVWPRGSAGGVAAESAAHTAGGAALESPVCEAHLQAWYLHRAS